MKKITVALTSIAVFLAPAAIQARYHHSYGYGDAYYTNVSGHRVHRPVHASASPSGASARCGDGSWSFSEHHQGTCSHHGGVSRWM